MIRTGLSRTKPAMATAVPVKALRSEITTGMSAPPIGRTIVTPKTRPEATTIARTRQRGRLEGERAGRPEDQEGGPDDRDPGQRRRSGSGRPGR